MSDKRSISQILFGYLPQQTVDVNGGVWKVKSWRNAQEERDVDIENLKREICRLSTPWSIENKDNGLVRDLQFSKATLRVKKLDIESGVHLEHFPRIWVCSNKKCERLHDSPDKKCKCGYTKKGHFPFVAYCEDCGNIREPYIDSCPTHDEISVKFPGTTASKDIKFQCPTCNTVVQQGFKSYAKCKCGGSLGYNVHRAAVVYTPRSVVIVNPPSKEKIKQIEDAGGGTRAISWILEGMSTSSLLETRPTKESLEQQLKKQQLPESTIAAILKTAEETGAFSDQSTSIPSLNSNLRQEAESQATTIALAMLEGRVRIGDLAKYEDPLSPAGILYNDRYKNALDLSGLEDVELIEKFPVLTGHYGYTRGSQNPGESCLVAFRDEKKKSDYVVYGDIAETEALFFRLSPIKVANWLSNLGHNLPSFNDDKTARSAILKACESEETKNDLLTLIHSYSHRIIRLSAVFAGIDRNALSELLVPLHLGFFMYAAAKGDFVLGGLQAVFETDLHKLLHEFMDGEHRCALDPGCSNAGCACIACLHLGEPSCRHFNKDLDRSYLVGEHGYLK